MLKIFHRNLIGLNQDTPIKTEIIIQQLTKTSLYVDTDWSYKKVTNIWNTGKQ